MYYPLELNEQLAIAIRAAAESKSALTVFAKKEESQIPERVSMDRMEELDEILCDVINRIAHLISEVIAYEAAMGSEERITDLIP